MTSILDLENHIRSMLPSNEVLEYFAFMGNANGIVKADNKGNVYVIRHDRSVVIVKNKREPHRAGLAVLVGYEKSNMGYLQVLRAVNAYLDPPYPAIVEHAETHARYGGDPVFINYEQILPGLATPTSTPSMTLQLRGFPYYLNGYHLLDNIYIDFTSHIPTSGARWVVVDVDSAGAITLRDGNIFASREVLTPDDIPLVTPGKTSPLAAKCYFGQTRFTQTKKTKDIFDMRFLGISSGGTATSVAWNDVTSKPADLVDIAALTPSNDDILQRKASKWTNRTMAQLAVDLAPYISGGNTTEIENAITLNLKYAQAQAAKMAANKIYINTNFS